MRRDLQQVRFIYSDDRDVDELHSRLASSQIDRSTLKLLVADGIQQLEQRDQQIIALYYFHDLRLP